MTELLAMTCICCLGYWLYKNGRRDGSRKAFGAGFRRGSRREKR